MHCTDAHTLALLTRGALADARMHHGWTALLVAALHGQASCVRLLCERAAKAHVDEADVDGTTALCVGAAEPAPLSVCQWAADRERSAAERRTRYERQNACGAARPRGMRRSTP